jgi:hypothetical protein
MQESPHRVHHPCSDRVNPDRRLTHCGGREDDVQIGAKHRVECFACPTVATAAVIISGRAERTAAPAAGVEVRPIAVSMTIPPLRMLRAVRVGSLATPIAAAAHPPAAAAR